MWELIFFWKELSTFKIEIMYEINGKIWDPNKKIQKNLKTQKLKLSQLKNSNCDKTPIVRKIQLQVAQLKNLNCDNSKS